jgi:hypothetical protein
MDSKTNFIRTLGFATFGAAAAVAGNAHAVTHASPAVSAPAPYRSASVDSVLIELLTNKETRVAFLADRDALIASRDLDAASAEALRGIRAEDLEGRSTVAMPPLPHCTISYICY